MLCLGGVLEQNIWKLLIMVEKKTGPMSSRSKKKALCIDKPLDTSDICLSANELECLRSYNTTLAAQYESCRSSHVALPVLLEAVIQNWKASGCPSSVDVDRTPVEATSILTIAAEQGKESRQAVAQLTKKAPPEQGNLLVWCGYPTSISRVSPFFPMNNKEKGRRDIIVKNLKASIQDKSKIVESSCYLINELVSSGPWGEIIYTGPKLSVEEEDALMALLAIIEAGKIDRSPQRRCEQNDDDMEQLVADLPPADLSPEQAAALVGTKNNTPLSFTYRGPVLPILRLMGHKRPGANHYEKLITSLKSLALGSMQLFVREKGEDLQYDLSQIISNLRLRPKDRELSVTVNPFFYQMYLANSLTWIDITKRFQIRGSIAKAMYRFCQSHRENPVFRGNIMTLALALNMDPKIPLKETRRQIREAIAELVEKKVLESTSVLSRTNLVLLNRTAEALPSKKKHLSR